MGTTIGRSRHLLSCSKQPHEWIYSGALEGLLGFGNRVVIKANLRISSQPIDWAAKLYSPR